MPLASTPIPDNLAPAHDLQSAVSWGAVIAGAASAAALSLILLILGVGLGLSSVSPWAQHGAGAVALGWATILWLTFTQVAASAMGGYLAGRLRTKWVEVHSEEVYFRDTAHGFLTWVVSTLATAALLTSVIASILGSPATGVDSERIADKDAAEIAHIVAERTGLSQSDAEKQMANVYAKAQAKLQDTELAAPEAVDKAHKASAYSALWLFISLLMGAFVASLAATLGGRQRDA